MEPVLMGPSDVLAVDIDTTWFEADNLNQNVYSLTTHEYTQSLL
jgi:hypothetical protein